MGDTSFGVLVGGVSGTNVILFDKGPGTVAIVLPTQFWKNGSQSNNPKVQIEDWTIAGATGKIPGVGAGGSIFIDSETGKLGFKISGAAILGATIEYNGEDFSDSSIDLGLKTGGSIGAVGFGVGLGAEAELKLTVDGITAEAGGYIHLGIIGAEAGVGFSGSLAVAAPNAIILDGLSKDGVRFNRSTTYQQARAEASALQLEAKNAIANSGALIGLSPAGNGLFHPGTFSSSGFGVGFATSVTLTGNGTYNVVDGFVEEYTLRRDFVILKPGEGSLDRAEAFTNFNKRLHDPSNPDRDQTLGFDEARRLGLPPGATVGMAADVIDSKSPSFDDVVAIGLDSPWGSPTAGPITIPWQPPRPVSTPGAGSEGNEGGGRPWGNPTAGPISGGGSVGGGGSTGGGSYGNPTAGPVPGGSGSGGGSSSGGGSYGNPTAGPVPGGSGGTSNPGHPSAYPIVLDLDGDGVELKSSWDGVSYDWDKDGFAEATGWVQADDGMLVYDDGITDESLEGPITSEDVMLSRIADGVTEHELDGETVLKKNPTDFDGLARFDINQDGVLDDKDIGTIKVAAKGEWDAKANDGEGDWVRDADGQIVRSAIGKVITQGDLDGSGNESVVLEDMAVDFANFKVWQDLDQDGEVDVSDDEKKNELKTLEEWDIVSFGISSFKDQLGTIKRLEADGAKVEGAGEVMVHVTADTVQNDRFWRKVGGKVRGGNYVV